MFAGRVHRGDTGQRRHAPAPARLLLPLAAVAGWLAVARPAAAQRLAGGLHLGGPVRMSFAGGVLFQESRADDARGVIALVEPGLRGGRLSLGYEAARGNLGTYVGGRVTMLRTWHVATPQTYTGAELQVLPLFAIGGRLGVFVPTTGTRRVLWIADVSLGL